MTRAFFLINIEYANRANTVFRPGVELAGIPGIKHVEETTGVYDLLVEIETTGKITGISDLLMSKPWVKRLHVLRGARAENLPAATVEEPL